MATLADSFLQDLEDLDDDEDVLDSESNSSGAPTSKSFGDVSESNRNGGCFGNLENDEFDEPIVDAIELYEHSKSVTVAIVSKLSTQSDFCETMAEIRRHTEREPELTTDIAEGSRSSLSKGGCLSSSEYDLIEKCNQLVSKLDIEILNIHSFIRDVYSKRFPELESIVFSPLEYIAVVQRIKNETDLTVIELTDILPNTVTMAVTVAASMTTGQPLPLSDLDKVLKASEEAMHLAECRKDVLNFLETRMGVLAPNVSAIIGSALAARLITHAGGIVSLARMPAQNIMLIGSSAASLRAAGISSGVNMTTNSTSATRSIIYGCDLIQSTPLAVRNRALKLVSGKLGLAARVDSFREASNGSVGRALRDKIMEALVKAQEPPPAPLKKSLPVPDDAPKSRRGGKRHRRAKEKYGLSEFQKQANRLAFGPEAEEEIGQEFEGAGFGLVNKGYGKLRLQAKQQKVQVKRQRRQQRQVAGISTAGGGATVTSAGRSSGATGGMSSSLAFTPIQGIELWNPEAFAKSVPTQQSNDYFASAVTFSKTGSAVKPVAKEEVSLT